MFGILLFAGITQSYNSPTCTAPSCNSLPPINEDSMSQYKIGSLALGTSASPTAGASLDVVGTINADSLISFGDVIVNSSGSSYLAHNLNLSKLAGTTKKALCVDSSGKLTSCAITDSVTLTINQNTIGTSGGTRMLSWNFTNSSGSCSPNNGGTNTSWTIPNPITSGSQSVIISPPLTVGSSKTYTITCTSVQGTFSSQVTLTTIANVLPPVVTLDIAYGTTNHATGLSTDATPAVLEIDSSAVRTSPTSRVPPYGSLVALTWSATNMAAGNTCQSSSQYVNSSTFSYSVASSYPAPWGVSTSGLSSSGTSSNVFLQLYGPAQFKVTCTNASGSATATVIGSNNERPILVTLNSTDTDSSYGYTYQKTRTTGYDGDRDYGANLNITGGSGSFTIPYNISKVSVAAIGGGGGGGIGDDPSVGVWPLGSWPTYLITDINTRDGKDTTVTIGGTTITARGGKHGENYFENDLCDASGCQAPSNAYTEGRGIGGRTWEKPYTCTFFGNSLTPLVSRLSCGAWWMFDNSGQGQGGDYCAGFENSYPGVGSFPGCSGASNTVYTKGGIIDHSNNNNLNMTGEGGKGTTLDSSYGVREFGGGGGRGEIKDQDITGTPATSGTFTIGRGGKSPLYAWISELFSSNYTPYRSWFTGHSVTPGVATDTSGSIIADKSAFGNAEGGSVRITFR